MSCPRDVVQAHLSAQLTRTLGRDATNADRQRAASHTMLPPALARRLAKSRDVRVLANLARNRAVPCDVVASLTSSNWDSVAHNALANPNCPVHLLQLTGDVERDRALLLNPNCPPDVVAAAYLAASYPREMAEHPNLPDDLREHALACGDWHVLHNPRTTQAQYDTFKGRIGTGPWAFSSSPGASPAWLADLAQERFAHSDQGTIARIARNPSTPQPTLLRIILEHAHADYALANPTCSPATLLATAAQERFSSRTGCRERRRLVALHPSSPLEALDALDVADFCGLVDLFEFILAHTRTAEQAAMVLALAPGWTGSLGELLRTTVTACASAAAPGSSSS